MILVLGGTADARQLAGDLARAGHQVLLSTATLLGSSLAGSFGGRSRHGPLTATELAGLIREEAVTALVDATHPYAVQVTENARLVCQELGLPYYRLRRPAVELPASSLVLKAISPQEAASLAAARGLTVFLATGVKDLPVYAARLTGPGRRLVVRVLPLEESLNACRRAGIPAPDIIAAQGPFSKDFNRECFQHCQASVVVTKNSGGAGGTAEKVAACLELNIPVVVIDRPPEPEEGYAAAELLRLLGRRSSLNEVKKERNAAMPSYAIVVLAHGSRAQAANQQLKELTAGLASRYSAVPIQPAYLAHCQPDLSQAVDALVRRGVDRLVVLPFFLWSGLHLQRDIPRLLELERQRYAGRVQLVLGRGLGYDSRLVDILADRVEEVISRGFSN